MHGIAASINLEINLIAFFILVFNCGFVLLPVYGCHNDGTILNLIFSFAGIGDVPCTADMIAFITKKKSGTRIDDLAVFVQQLDLNRCLVSVLPELTYIGIELID